ncbi:ABC transporter ATP-binding protein/permease [Anaerocolumna jejuensis]|uniref:ABC transporter ATP-binding protein/permease n=1 Tax=Anaerocolumna jejuensis TaxID=259063 RepID=UPI003F7C45D6
MLELVDIKRAYNVGGIETKALDGVSVAFRQKEFVAILGSSGSGKTTCLNIIGGLDRYDSGELIIKGKKTADFTDRDWDAYRNNSIGFVFQSYNLIMHLSIVANVELGMTLSGVTAEEKHRKALEVLEKVGLKEHLHKKPNQLSGGQMQRVAIARALANDPEILLCDEPTGALDSNTSIQIMELIKEVAKERLVIMVTHNPELAQSYADRIIRFQDGKIISDSHPHVERPKADEFKLKKTSMSFLTALRLSFNNIRTKKGRTILTAFASSIGIIGIAVILSLSSGFQTQIDNFQRDAMAEFPIIISQSATTVDAESMKNMRKDMTNQDDGSFAATDKVTLYDPADTQITHRNIFTQDYLDYLNKIDPEICSSIGYSRLVSMNMVRKVEDKVIPVTLSSQSSTSGTSGNGQSGALTGSVGLSSYPKQLKTEEESYLTKNYDLMAGEYPVKSTDLVLVIDEKNRLDYNILQKLGFDTDGKDSINLSDIVGTEFKIVPNDVYYLPTQAGTYLPGNDYQAMYDSKEDITVKITGVVRQKEDVAMALLLPGIAYSDELSEMVIDSAQDSAIVKAQEKSDKNIITNEELTEDSKESLLAYLGGSATPYVIMVYPYNFDAKDAVTDYLDTYNEGKASKDQVVYTDLADTMSSLTSGIMDGITIVLIAFAGISLVVSLIMISIITYTSVLERTKEIGILRALGARKKDITRVFDAETAILGVFSGILGVILAWLATFPINTILYKMAELTDVAHLQIEHAVILVVISTVLTVLGGHIPARMASRKNAIEALRTE